tara:strand:+ start:6962 stop:7264 length:303 start_codon:yes stop_codon:yes gene_type:complete
MSAFANKTLLALVSSTLDQASLAIVKGDFFSGALCFRSIEALSNLASPTDHAAAIEAAAQWFVSLETNLGQDAIDFADDMLQKTSSLFQAEVISRNAELI